MRTWTTGRSIRVVTGLVAAAAVAGVAIGCGDDDDKESSAKPAGFAIEATAQGKKLTLSHPASVSAGLVSMTLKNSDKRPRGAQIVRIVGDHNSKAVVSLIEGESIKIPEYIQDGGGVAAVKPGETKTVTQNLAPGKYIVWDDQGGDDDTPGNWSLGALGEFTVTGEASDDELPSRPATITALDKGDKDYGFAFKGLKAGTNQVRFENTGKQLHHALFFPLQKGATLADLRTFLKSDGKGEPPLDFAKGVGTTVIDGGVAQNVELDLTAGNYAVLCFIPDRKGGKSHADKGMVEELVVK